MKTWIYILIMAVVLICGCEESFTREVAVPLKVQLEGEIHRISGLDVQAMVEKIVSDAELKPHVEDRQADDLFSAAADVLNTHAANTRTWKHPTFPLFLSMTRQKGEYLLLLNVAEEKPDANTKKLYKQLEKQLTALPAKLTVSKIQNDTN